MSDSDGDDDAMAYFLPNGIADDSPPKRSALMASSSFGSIGATRFGGIYASSAASTAPPPALDLPTPRYGALGSTTTSASSATASSVSATPSSSSLSANFLLSDLGGELLAPRAHDATGSIGTRHPFAFSGAFASLASSSDSGRFAEPNTRSAEMVLTPKNASTATSSGFRSDEIFAPATSGVYGRPTLNANAPAFMASSAVPQETAAPFGSTSPSAWPTMNVKPRRAPPGLSKPTEHPASPSTSLPPGLPHPSQSTGAFGGYGSSSSSVFSGDSVREFAAKLRPNFPSLSDAFRSNTPSSNDEFKSALSELNAKSLSVEEVQSNLRALATAAAQDVVAEDPVELKPARLSTPRKATKSPRRGVDFKSPNSNDEKRGNEQAIRGPTDPRSRTPTHRNDAGASGASVGAASPATGKRGGDRRGRNARDSTASEEAGRTAKPAPSESGSSRSSRRGRGGGGASTDPRPVNRNAQPEPTAGAISIPTTRTKKPPSSVSSAGSDDQLLAISTLEDTRDAPPKTAESKKEPKATGRNANPKKSPVPQNEKRGGQKRQVYREKVVVPEASKAEVVETKSGGDAVVNGGSDADASGVDSQEADDTVEDDVKIASVEVETPPVAEEVDLVAPIDNVDDVSSAPDVASAPVSAPLPEVQEVVAAASPKKPVEVSFEPTVDVQAAASEVEDEKAAVPDSPHAPESQGPFSNPSQLESDSGSEIPDVSSRTVRTTGSSDRKTSAKEKKSKKDKSDKKKAATTTKASKKEKRESSSSGKGDLADDEPFDAPPTKKQSVVSAVKISALLRDGRMLVKRGVATVWNGCWFLCTEFADRVNLKGFLGWTFSYLESFLAVVFSVVLLLSLHGASFFIRLHRVAFRAVLTHRHVGFCFAFLYAFPFLVQYVFPWAPPWAPVCLWYAFLVQLFCTSGPAAMVATFRIILPLMFLVEGISHHSFLLDLNGAELLLASFILSAMKTSNLCSPIFLISLAVQCLSAVFLGSELVVQWFQMTLALYSLHAMAATDEDWAGLGDEEEELSCRPLSTHHSIADYNYHPAPSAPSIQKTKRLDRRALAYVRGRKLR